MKKRFSILIVSTVIIGLALSLFGMALVPQTASAERAQNSYRQAPKPIPAVNVKVVKKIPLSLDMEETKGKPDGLPGKDKDNGSSSGAATGILGTKVTGNKYAIVIGICDYPGKTGLDLCQSDGDSLRMYKALTELYGYEPGNIYLFKDGGGTTGFVVNPATGEKKTAGVPTRDDIYQAIMDIKTNSDLTQDDEVVFFFSGHGASGEANDGVNGTDDGEFIDEAILVWKTENDIADNITHIWDGELRNWFDGFATTRIAFVFDTCLAGGMNDLAADGRVISMATDETHSAYVYSSEKVNQDKMEDVDGDGQLDGEGVFSRLFVNKGMLQGLADVYDHGQRTNPDVLGEDVVVEEAFDYAKENIPPYLKRRQKPVIDDKFDFDNDLLL